MNQLVFIPNDIDKLSNEGYEVTGVIHNILKTFDKVWHEDIFFKLKQNGISGNLLSIVKDLWNKRK